MHPGIMYALLGALVFGLWTVFHQQASKNINNLFGAIIVSITAVIVGGAILFLSKTHQSTLIQNPKGILFAILAGICALGIDYFALKSYSSGLQISLSGPIIIGGSIAIASTIGFFLGDSVTLIKILGLVLIIAGSALLAAQG